MVVCCSTLAIFSGTELMVLPMLAAGLLGFADNVLNLEWRWKLIVPPMTLAPLVRSYIQHNQFIIPLYGFGSKFGIENITLPSFITYIIINAFSVYA